MKCALVDMGAANFIAHLITVPMLVLLEMSSPLVEATDCRIPYRPNAVITSEHLLKPLPVVSYVQPGTVIAIGCQYEGAMLSGLSTAICQFDGTFDASLGRCIPASPPSSTATLPTRIRTTSRTTLAKTTTTKPPTSRFSHVDNAEVKNDHDLEHSYIILIIFVVIVVVVFLIFVAATCGFTQSLG